MITVSQALIVLPLVLLPVYYGITVVLITMVKPYFDKKRTEISEDK